MRLNPFRRRNPFNEGYDHYTAFNQGELIPIYTQEVYPGDTFSITNWAFVRYAPMIAPKFGRDGLYIHYFFVPNRLIFDKWEQFITKGFTGNDNTEWPHVVSPEGGFTKYSLADYFGWQLGVAGLEVSALKPRAYNLIYNSWYRQEFLQDEVGLSKDEGVDSVTSLQIQMRNWQKDYYTRALPFRQLGAPVQIPISTESAPVSAAQTLDVTLKAGENSPRILSYDNLTPSSNLHLWVAGAGSGNQRLAYGGTTADVAARLDPNGSLGVNVPKLEADLTSATATSVNTLRTGVQIQRWMERNARGGVRYIESILAHFGVKSSDARLQRPEFLGGGKAYTAFSEVLQTSSTNSTSPQGNMSGHGVNAAKTVNFTKSFEEHGWIIGICSVMTDTMYCQGIPREDTRKTALDYMWPEFTHLGEQGILNKEIFAQGPTVLNEAGTPVDDDVFGYVPMYDELRRRRSVITSDMRDSLSFWSQARIFSELPTLSSQFLKANHDNRVFAVTDNNVKHLWAQIHFDVKAVRPLPRHGDPGFLDH